jgi:hypothetical protein
MGRSGGIESRRLAGAIESRRLDGTSASRRRDEGGVSSSEGGRRVAYAALSKSWSGMLLSVVVSGRWYAVVVASGSASPEA